MLPMVIVAVGAMQRRAMHIATIRGALTENPHARCVPLADVRGEDMARGSTYMGGPTPKATAARRDADRKNGERIYDSHNALTVWRRLSQPRPAPPENPRNPLAGFDDDAIELAKLGRDISRKAAEAPPAAAHIQWI